jgi:hypothetical protein
MPGGLIQLVSHGASDAYLTGNPEITFFKVVYRRYTNFSMESIEKRFDSLPNFGKTVSCLIEPTGDLIHKIYLKIDLPEINFTNKDVINDNEYKVGKQILVENYMQIYLDKKKEYDNFFIYSKFNIDAYKILSVLLLPDEINLQYLKTKILSFKSINNDDIDSNKLLINSDYIQETDIISYVLNYNDYSADNSEIRNIIKLKVEKMYQNLHKILKIYFNNYTNSYKKYQKIENDKIINFAWIKRLGNFICSNIELEIGGQVIESHDYYWRFIWDQISIDFKKRDMYDKMTGNTINLTNFDEEPKESYTLLIPLLFTFCRYPGMSLPLIALKYHDVRINIDFSKIEECCYLEDYEKEYYQNKIVEYSKDELIYNKNSELYDLKYNIKIDLERLKLDQDRNIFNYQHSYHNRKTLNLNYRINDLDANYILKTYGSIKPNMNYHTINLQEFIIMKYNTTDSRLDKIFKSTLDYHKYLNKKHLLESINMVDATLLVDYIYLDEMERKKFAQSKHEYLIEKISNNLLDNLSNKRNLFDLSFRHPVKELFWFVQPESYNDSTKPYQESKYYNFTNKYFQEENYLDNPIETSELELNTVSIFPKDVDSKFFNYLTVDKTHSNIANLGLNLYSFSLFPEEQQPSGSCNFSSFKSKKLIINLNEDYYKEYKENNIILRSYSLHYNVLRIMGGMGALSFN